jgi:hypothetical protein
MLNDTQNRLPFTDFYDTVTADMKNFCHRSVQGAIWMAEYKRHLKENKGYIF